MTESGDAGPDPRTTTQPRRRREGWRRVHRAEAAAEGLFSALGVSSPKRLALFAVCLGAALAAVLVPDATAGLAPPARRALFILVFAGLLWVTDAVPAFAVGLLVIGLQVALLGTASGGAGSAQDWQTFVAVLGDPMVWLFFGGFVLAAGMSRAGLDRRLAARVLARTGDRPAAVLAGLMGLAFGLSMFMSNTATTAMVLALIGPLLAALPEDDPRGRALILGTAGAANLGGMASLIGTPPNAVAAGALASLENAPRVDFLRWLGMGLPVALLLALGLWWFLRLRLPDAPLPTGALQSAAETAAPVPRWERLVVIFTVLVTAGAWATGEWHGIPTAAVSFVPIVLLTLTGVLGTREIRALPYDVLFLLAGGLALANVVGDTGLSGWIVRKLPVDQLGSFGLALAFAALGVVLSTLMSNTAAANLLVPLGMAVAAGGEESRVVLPIALCTSAAMALPISTPPNALAYATGRLRARDFLLPGLLIGAVTPPLAVLWVRLWY